MERKKKYVAGTIMAVDRMHLQGEQNRALRPNPDTRCVFLSHTISTRIMSNPNLSQPTKIAALYLFFHPNTT